MVKCEYCELWYCYNHKDSGGHVAGGGHCCDIGCDTTTVYKKNCKGTKSQVMKCPAGCGYKFCAHHYMPVPGVWTLQGGHVCKKVTIGSEALGDSAADYLTLVGVAACAVATGGTSAGVAAAGKAAGKAVAKNVAENCLDYCIAQLPEGDKFLKNGGNRNFFAPMGSP